MRAEKDVKPKETNFTKGYHVLIVSAITYFAVEMFFNFFNTLKPKYLIFVIGDHHSAATCNPVLGVAFQSYDVLFKIWFNCKWENNSGVGSNLVTPMRL